MSEVHARLRGMLSDGSGLIAPGVFDGLSACVTVEAGFRAAYLTGAGVAAVLGVPDIGLTTQTEMVGQVELVASSVDVPVIADADTGFGDVANNTYRTVQVYAQASRLGYLADLAEAGATVTNPTCGACFGHHMGVLAPGEVCLTANTRNFTGRMGGIEAQVYMASPATVAASAIRGVISDVRELEELGS